RRQRAGGGRLPRRSLGVPRRRAHRGAGARRACRPAGVGAGHARGRAGRRCLGTPARGRAARGRAAVTFALGVLVFLVGLAVSIALHELGHMVPAKRFGVRVSRFMIGLGPTLGSRTWGRAESGITAVPAGGLVRLAGMIRPAAAVGQPGGRGRLARIAAAAREEAELDIRPGEEQRAFYLLSAPKKLVVMLG